MMCFVRLRDEAVNVPLISYLQQQSSPGRGDSWDLQGWKLHVHPDLSDRLVEISPSGVELVPAYGLYVLAGSGIAAGFVTGTGCLFLRLPMEPEGVARGRQACQEAFSAPNWYGIDPWQSDLPTRVGLRRLRLLTASALQHALTLR
jgi:hypothetical protein